MQEHTVTNGIESQHHKVCVPTANEISLKSETGQPLEDLQQDHVKSLALFVTETSQLLANNSILTQRIEEPHVTQNNGKFIRKQITDSLNSGENSIVVALRNGAIPSTLKLQDQQIPNTLSRIHLIDITTYADENMTVFTDLIGSAPSQVFDEQKLSILHDDVADSLLSVATFLLARRLSRLGPDFEETDAQMMIDALIKSRELDFEESIHIYHKLVPLMQAENTVIAMLFYKNKPFLHTLRQHVKQTLLREPTNQWAQAQWKFIGSDVLLYGQQTWLMGGPGLDTGFSGKDLVAEVPDDLKANPLIAQYLDTASKLTFRIGAICEGLVALKPDKSGIFSKWVINQFIDHLRSVVESSQPQNPPSPTS